MYKRARQHIVYQIIKETCSKVYVYISAATESQQGVRMCCFVITNFSMKNAVGTIKKNLLNQVTANQKLCKCVVFKHNK